MIRHRERDDTIRGLLLSMEASNMMELVNNRKEDLDSDDLVDNILGF